MSAPMQPRRTNEGAVDTNWTVEEASRFLSCEQPLPRELLSKLGRDCSLVCRIHGHEWTLRPVTGKDWTTERAYPVAVIREVFLTNPATAPYVPKGMNHAA